jgi:hypothetical protein
LPLRDAQLHSVPLAGDHCAWENWIAARNAGDVVDLVVAPWVNALPTLDLWLHVEIGEMRYVRDLIPTLDWDGGRLGVWLRYEPKDLGLLFKDFMGAVSDAEALKAAAIAAAKEHQDADPPPGPPKLTIWPESLVDFLSKRLSTH